VNAKLLNKLLDQTKTDARAIARLERDKLRLGEQLAAARSQIDAAVADALAANRAAHDADWASAQERHDGLSEVIRRLRAEFAAVQEKHAEMTNDRDHWQEVARSLSEELHGANDKIAELEPRIALLAEQRAELEKLCAKVRDRMRRREHEEEQAILNRKIVTGAVPARRRIA